MNLQCTEEGRKTCASAGNEHRANNILVTVAHTVDDIFYKASESADNLYAYHDGQLGATEHILCRKVLQGKIVQLQNNNTDSHPFHLSEVEVYGF